MKKWWKKINRGLLLGAVLLIGLIGFIVFKEAQFQKEIPTIQDTAEAYIHDLLELNLSLEGENLGKKLTEGQRAEKMAAMDRLIVDYMADGDGSKGSYHVYTAQQLRDNYEKTLEGKVQTIYRNLDFDIPENRIQVTQEGGDYANVSIYLQNVTVEGRGYLDQLFGGDYLKHSYDVEIYDKGIYEIVDGEELEEDPIKSEDAWYGCTYSGNVVLQMKRVDGEWRVTGAYCYTWMQSMQALDEKEGVKK